MAGQSIKRKRRKILDDLGEEGVFSLYLNEYKTVGALCDFLFEPHGEGAKRPGRMDFYRWCKAVEGRWERWQEVKKMRAEDIAEGALTVALEAGEDNVRSAKLKHDAQRWYAATLDRDTYGSGPQVQVNNNTVNVLGEQIAEALRAIEAEERERRVITATVEDEDVNSDSQ